MMESPRKFNDCYFYYYSTCTKGDNCVFRHEPSALGCETMCTAWQQGKCLDKHCKLRHMELRKNRKQIPCYWENQPGGCRKKHCPFMHKNPDARTDGIAPSQPALPVPAVAAVANPAEPVPVEPQPLPAGVPPVVAPPAPVPVPLLWQQQRPVVLDSSILGVLPTTNDLLAGRRVVPHGHAHPHAHAEYGVGTVGPVPGVGAVPVDPLVVNFEEESDNESGLSSTPTKTVCPDEAQTTARNKSQELLLLEKIQAEAAAFYSYDCLPPIDPPKERKLVRTNLSIKYDKLSLDEIAGKKQCAGERRNSLDFKVLSLDEIRARKKSSETIIHSTPITLNLCRKRKLSTQETITTSGNKIIKVVRSNSIVYKKVDHNAPAVTSRTKAERKQQNNESMIRKRTLSEQSIDIYDIQEDELVDNCYEFKRIKFAEQTSKPILIMNPNSINRSNSEVSDVDVGDSSNRTDDSDPEVQIVNVSEKEVDVSDISDSEVIVVDSTKAVNSTDNIVDIVDLSDDQDDGELTVLDIDLDKNVPDVVASCQKSTNKQENTNGNLIHEIDEILGDSLC